MSVAFLGFTPLPADSSPKGEQFRVAINVVRPSGWFLYCPPVLGGQVAFLSFTPPPAAPPLRQGRNWLAIVAEGGILCVCVFGADTSVRPYGFVLLLLGFTPPPAAPPLKGEQFRVAINVVRLLRWWFSYCPPVLGGPLAVEEMMNVFYW